jgi:hypothetical protein
MDWPTTYFAAQALVSLWAAPDPAVQQEGIKFAVSAIEFICRKDANPVQCAEGHWGRHSGSELINLVDQEKRKERRANGIPDTPGSPICPPPYKMTARDGCQ